LGLLPTLTLTLMLACAISKKRTGNDFAELHRWIDEPKRKYGYNHRIIRHSYTEDDKNTIRKYWDEKGKGLGEKTIVEWLFHIAIDNLDTAFKMSSQSFSYGNKAYNFMQFGLNRSGYIHCDFDRVDDKELHVMFEDEPEEEGILKQMFRSIFG
jgi:hypothetical protein